jgi:hypothetical protein
MKHFNYLWLIGLWVGLSGCSSKYGDNIDTVLKVAGSNQPELEAVLEHYPNPADSLKRKAAYFLVEHLPFRKAQTAKSSLLIQNIELAFEAWQKPWSKALSFDEFKELILPFDLQTDSTGTFWRKRFAQEYAFVTDSIKNYPQYTPVVAACFIVDKAMRKKYSFEFDRDQTTSLNLNGWEKVRKSDCADMANLTNHIMRSVGIPTTTEFTPQWGNSSYRHYWNVLLVNKHFVPFMGTEAPPQRYKVELEIEHAFIKKRPKVFRINYAFNNESLSIQADEEVPPLLDTPNAVDVSKERMPTQNITLNVPDSIKNSYAYLSVSMRTAWSPSFWGKINDGKVLFRDMRPEVLYILSYFEPKKDTLITWGYPFILQNNGKPLWLNGNTKQTEKVTCYRKHPRDDSNLIKIGDAYQLYYWTLKGWKLLGSQTAESATVTFDGVPKNALLILRNASRGRQERVFIYQKGQQVFI